MTAATAIYMQLASYSHNKREFFCHMYSICLQYYLLIVQREYRTFYTIFYLRPLKSILGYYLVLVQNVLLKLLLQIYLVKQFQV